MSLGKLIKYKIAKATVKWRRKIHPPVIPSYKEERILYIVKTLIKDEKSTMLIAPISGKKYIKSDSRGIFVIIDDVNITISSNVKMYYYNIKVHEQISKILTRNFNNVLEIRRNSMEKETIAGVTTNLDYIAQHINDFEKTEKQNINANNTINHSKKN